MRRMRKYESRGFASTVVFLVSVFYLVSKHSDQVDIIALIPNIFQPRVPEDVILEGLACNNKPLV